MRSTNTPARPTGTNQDGLREYNERIVLQTVRLHREGLAKADVARLTQLSAQSASQIVDRLVDEGLLRKLAPVRGRVGQPSVPIVLDPDGAFSVGISVGRRSIEVLHMDFVGAVRARSKLTYDFPDPEVVVREIEAQLAHAPSGRLAGIGIAAPHGMGGWHEVLGMPRARAKAWDGFALRERVQALTHAPVMLLKDTSAACVAELIQGQGRERRNFLYLFVATFIGGGVVLGGQLHAGVHGNAGAVASLPLGLAAPTHMPAQVLNAAALRSLELTYRARKLDPEARYDARALTAPWREHTEAWLTQAANAMAFAITNANAVLDIGHVIIDGTLDHAVLELLLTRTRAALSRYNWEGLFRPEIEAGTIGHQARALGGALMPLYARFSPHQDALRKVA